MACSVSEFRTRFPEFQEESEFSNVRIQLFLDDAAYYMGSSESRWCGRYNYAHCYLAAHLLSIGTNSEMGDSSSKLGVITSKTAGGVSVTRSSSSSDRSDADSFYISTVYGQVFLNVRNSCFAGVLVANCL